jgi:hypothetical protein
LSEVLYEPVFRSFEIGQAAVSIVVDTEDIAKAAAT